MDDFDFVSVTLTKKTYQELLEKAKKCDEFVKKNLTQCEQLMDCTIIPNNDLEKLKYKAKEYDGIVDEYWNRGGKSQVLEWKEKAKELDNIADSGRGIWKWSDVREWQEKAKKLDEIASGYAGPKSANFWTDQYVHSLEEKANKWDKFVLNKDDLRYWDTAWFRELEDKAKKWDEFEKKNLTQCEQLMDCTIIQNEDLDELKKKARRYDRMKELFG